ncbi:MAG: hypothetical protein JW784_03475, partial [Candidatus Cloacimonetes bacterium]|nr:hypothetical protein [Candidatus Cloacimonadota bacterium]
MTTCRMILEEIPLLKKLLNRKGRLNPDFRQLQELIQELNQNPAFSSKHLQSGELNGILLITEAINIVQETYYKQS